MRITVIPKIGRETKHIPLEVESSDTVGNVKAKIEETEWIHRDANRLIYSETSLQDNRSLEDYDIQEESTLLLVLKLGVPLIYIKNWIGKMFALDFRRQSLSLSTSVVYNIKQKVEEKEGIPPDKQRLYFAGKLLDDTRTLADYDIKYGFILYLDRIPDDDAIVDIAAIQARWRAARSKAKVTGDEAEPVIMFANGDSKRAREDSSYTPPQSSTGGLLLYGANRKNGVESFWDEEDFGLARRRSQALVSRYDINRFECIDDRTLIESVANSSVCLMSRLCLSTGCKSIRIH